MSKESAAFAQQIVDSLATIERCVNAAISPAEAAPHLVMAIEAIALSVPLYAPDAVAKRKEALGHAREMIYALGHLAGSEADPAGSGCTTRSPFQEAVEHRTRADHALDELREMTRSDAQRAYNATPAAQQDVAAMVEALSQPPAGRPANPLYTAMAAGDIERAMRLAGEAARSTAPAPTATRIDKSERGWFAQAIANWRPPPPPTTTRLNPKRHVARGSMALVPPPPTPEPQSVAAVAHATTVAAGVRLTIPLGSSAPSSPAPPSLPVLNDEAVLARCGQAQSAFAQFASFTSALFETRVMRFRRYASERLRVIQCWADEIVQDDGRLAIAALNQFYEATLSRRDQNELVALDASLDPLLAKHAAAGPFVGFSLSFTEVASLVPPLAAEARALLSRVEVGESATAEIQRAKAAFEEYVAAEKRTLFVYGDQLDRPSEPPRRLGALPNPPRPAAAREIQRPAYVVDANRAVAAPVADTVMQQLVDSALATVRAEYVADATRAIKPLESAPLPEAFRQTTPAAVDPRNSYVVGSITLAVRADDDGLPSTNGALDNAPTRYVDPSDVALDQTPGANAVECDLATGVCRPLYLEPTLEEAEPIFDDFAAPFGLARGLESHHAPWLVTAFYGAVFDQEDRVLLRLPQLIGYIRAVGYVPYPLNRRQMRLSTVIEEVWSAKNTNSKLETMISAIEAVHPGNAGAFAARRTLVRLPERGTVNRELAHAYVRTALQEIYRFELSALWPYAQVVGHLADARNNTRALQIAERFSDTVGTRNQTRTDLLEMFQTSVNNPETRALLMRSAAAFTDARINIGNRQAAAPNQRVQVRAINGAVFGPEYQNQLLLVAFYSKRALDAEGFPVTLEGRFRRDPATGQNAVRQRLSIARDTPACSPNASIDECLWTFFERSEFYTAPGGSGSQRLIADTATGEFALVSFYHLDTGVFGPVLRSAIAASPPTTPVPLIDTSAAAPNPLAAAPLDSADTRASLEWLRRYSASVGSVSAGLASALASGASNVGATIANFARLVGTPLAPMQTNTAAFEAMTYTFSLIEWVVRTANLVLDYFPAVRRMIVSCCRSVASTTERCLIAMGLAILGEDNARADRLYGWSDDDESSLRAFRSWVGELILLPTSASVRTPDARPPAPSLLETPVPRERYVFMHAYPENDSDIQLAAAMDQVLYRIQLEMLEARSLWHVLVDGWRMLRYYLANAASGIVYATTNRSSVSDTLFSVARVSTLAMLAAVTPEIWAHSSTFVSSAIMRTVAGAAMMAGIELVATIIEGAATAVTPGGSLFDWLPRRRRFTRELLTIVGLTGSILAPWMRDAEYRTVAELSPDAPGRAAVYDLVSGVGAASAASGQPSEMTAEELAALAGIAIGRMYGPQLVAYVGRRTMAAGRSWFASTLAAARVETRGRRPPRPARTLDDEVRAVTEAFAPDFGARIAKADPRSPLAVVAARSNAVDVWREIAVLAVVATPDGRLGVTEHRSAAELRLFGANLVDYIRSSTARHAQRLRAADRAGLRTGERGEMTTEFLQHELRNALFYETPEFGQLIAAVRGTGERRVEVDLLQAEVATILRKDRHARERAAAARQ